MRNIHKKSEPHSLTQHRLWERATFDNIPDKESLQRALVNEQRGLCCYCMDRISADWNKMRIEHCRSQKRHSDETLDYRNLLAACRGGEGGKEHHCDTKKGGRDLSRNPADPAHDVEAIIHYGKDGRISSSDVSFDKELNEVLNLNARSLKRRRKEVLDGFLRTHLAGGKWPKARVRKLRARWHGDSHSDLLDPFCQVVVYYLDKRLSRP